jgi:hypothetical protein
LPVSRFKLAGYLPRLRETPFRRPGEYQFPVNGNVKDAIGTGDQNSVNAALPAQFSRQTDGFRLEVSRRAVIDIHSHYTPPIIKIF